MAAMNYIQVRQRSRLFRDGLKCRTREMVSKLTELGFEDGALLDVGAADGAMLQRLRAVFPHGHYLGIDAHESYVQAAQQRLNPVIAARADDIPCRTARFDVVTIVSTLKHISDYTSVLRECARVLRPGGHLIISDVSPFGIRLGSLGGHFRKPPIENSWSLSQASDALSAAGLEVVSAHHYMPLPLLTPWDEWLSALLDWGGATAFCMQQMVVAKVS